MSGSGDTSAREFDDVLQMVGSFGWYQKMRIAFLFVPTAFFFGFSSSSMMFETVVPPHWCHVPGMENTTLTLEEWKNLTLPPSNNDPDKFSSCQMYDGVWERQGDAYTYIVTNTTKDCMYGWDFDRSEFRETISTALLWVCDRGHYTAHSLSINLLGRAIGTFLLPMLADNYFGRRYMFFIAVSFNVVFTIPLLWVTLPSLRLVFRFLQGFGYETNYLMPYVIIMELIPPAYRDISVMLTFVSWTCGMCLMSLVAWLAGHWWTVALVSVFPFLACYPYWSILPESPRWLLSKGRLQECADILMQIGRVNGATQVSEEQVNKELHSLSLRLPTNEPLTKAFVYPKLRLRAAMLFLLSFTQFLEYGVILLSMSVMPGSYFVSHLVLSLSEIPSVFVGLPVTHYFGRRFLGASTILLSILCFLAAPFCMHNNWLLLAVLALAKLSCTSTLYLIFLLPSEVLPTPVRTSGAGLSVVSGMLGMTLSPHLIHSGMGGGFHYWVLLAVCIIALATLIPLPETLGLLMPQTFQEGEDLGKGRPFTKWIHHWNLHKYPSSPAEGEKEEGQELMNGKEC